jgi:parvulin-like peptidyl-prolyl isomerase
MKKAISVSIAALAACTLAYVAQQAERATYAPAAVAQSQASTVDTDVQVYGHELNRPLSGDKQVVQVVSQMDDAKAQIVAQARKICQLSAAATVGEKVDMDACAQQVANGIIAHAMN